MTTTLRELVGRLDELDREVTLYAEGGRDAQPDAPAVAAIEPEDGSLPPEADGLDYVLEVFIARDVLDVWSKWREGRQPTTDEACEAILHYARRDAYLPVEGGEPPG